MGEIVPPAIGAVIFISINHLSPLLGIPLGLIILKRTCDVGLINKQKPQTRDQ